MARVPVPRSSPVAAEIVVDNLADVRDDADAADIRALSRLLDDKQPDVPKLTEQELHRRFGKMLDRVYEYAQEHDSPISAVVLDYRTYLTRLSLQDLDGE